MIATGSWWGQVRMRARNTGYRGFMVYNRWVRRGSGQGGVCEKFRDNWKA